MIADGVYQNPRRFVMLFSFSPSLAQDTFKRGLMVVSFVGKQAFH